MVLEVPDSFDENQINEEATKKCTCEEAVAAARKEEIKAEAMLNIKELLNEHEDLETLRKEALDLVEPIGEWKIHSATLKYSKYTLKITRKPDTISISLKFSEENKRG